jgi:hypothetical protein
MRALGERAAYHPALTRVVAYRAADHGAVRQFDGMRAAAGAGQEDAAGRAALRFAQRRLAGGRRTRGQAQQQLDAREGIQPEVAPRDCPAQPAPAGLMGFAPAARHAQQSRSSVFSRQLIERFGEMAAVGPGQDGPRRTIQPIQRRIGDVEVARRQRFAAAPAGCRARHG